MGADGPSPNLETGEGNDLSPQTMNLPTPFSSSSVWVPAQETSWQWVLGESDPNLTLRVDVYDLDLFETPATTVDALHARGVKVICYISAGSIEDWRPDSYHIPDEVIGKKYAGWEGERWLDIRAIDQLAPVMLARLDLCAEKGFDGLEPDNIDGYTNKTGFPLSYQDQLEYNIWLANEAHLRGLSIGLKNDPEQAQDLVAYFDWALTEDCFDQEWCEMMAPFLREGKAVFDAEYTDTGIALEDFCPLAEELGINAILKNRDLDGYLQSCP